MVYARRVPDPDEPVEPPPPVPASELRELVTSLGVRDGLSSEVEAHYAGWEARQAERETAFQEAVALADQADNRVHSTHQNGGLVIGEHVELHGRELAPGAICFSVGGGVEVLRFEPDGKAYVQGKLVDQPEEVIHALRWFLFHLHHVGDQPRAETLSPRSYCIPKFVLGQKLRSPDGFEGVVVVIFHGISMAETWEIFLHGPRYDDNQIFYGLRGPAGHRVLVGEHSAIPVVPTSEPEVKFTRVSVWERLLAEMLSGVNSGT